MRVITRPLQSTVERAKVDDFKEKIKASVESRERRLLKGRRHDVDRVTVG